MNVIASLVVTGIIFGILDFFWLGRVGRPLYDERMGSILKPEFNMVAALIFYVIYVAGITYFATQPALAEGSFGKAVVAGAFLGFFAYATYNLTALAVLKGYPASIVAIDMAWGTVATAISSGGTYLVIRALPWFN
ncbi:DUF2177 family protein [Ornithinimicrobium sp. Arc0846-15]|nr:DUF2177 family protein [Ornithinimicrobium laminariae]